PVGDLVRDISFDKGFPHHSVSRKHLRDYLESMGACDSAMSIFEEAFSHYEQDAKN
ncbi:MAG: YozE family protein, partial [Treponema sp.]|uniref:YozE family protein n=1 Tax=Treponema sp. TaxID=166 RepID=UPI003FA220B9